MSMSKQHDFEIRARRVVFAEVRRVTSAGVKMKDIAKKAGVTPQTVSKLAYGETKYPRFHTVIGVLHALGIRMEIVMPSDNIVPMMKDQKRAK